MQPGDKFTRKFDVSKEVYQGFIETFQDRNPLHTDDEFANTFGFREKVMHGNILNGFVSCFVGEGLPIKNVVIQSQSIQFALPVYMNDQLEFYAEIKEYFESVYAYCFGFYFKNQFGKKVARGEIQIGLII